MLSFVKNVVTFIAAYTALDAVVPDLDSFETIPDNMKWTYGFESQVTNEFLGLLRQNTWKSMEKSQRLNLTIDWIYSKAYKRDIIKFTTFFNRSLAEVVDSIWLDVNMPRTGWGWKILFSKSRLLSYAGRNKVILAQESEPAIPGWLISSRDFITLHFLLENNESIRRVLLRNNTTMPSGHHHHVVPDKNLQTPDNSLAGSGTIDKGYSVMEPYLEGMIQQPMAMLLITNVSNSHFDTPPPTDTVRVSVGTAGLMMTEVSSPDQSSSPPTSGLTKVEWLTNSDGHPPAFMPTTVVRRVLANTLKSAISEWKSYLETKSSVDKGSS